MQIITKHQQRLVVLSIVLGTCILVGPLARAEPQVAACEPKAETASSQAENSNSAKQLKADHFDKLSERPVQFRLGNDLSGGSSSVRVRGSAESLERNEEGKYLLKHASATKCPDGNNDVVIEASEMEIDPDAGEGKAKNATLRFKNIPVFYSPVLYFPIDQRRRSGFLYPSIGYSSSNGTTLEIPYYFNLAPNFDSTATFRSLTRRGVQIDTEFRYLGHDSQAYSRLEFLPNDRRYHGRSRTAFLIDYDWYQRNQYYADIHSRWVSDDDYLKNFVGPFGKRDQKYLVQKASFHSVGKRYLLSGGFERYSGIGSGAVPYNRMPWLKIQTRNSISPYLEIRFQSMLDRFDDSARLSGWRYNTIGGFEVTHQKSFGNLSFGAGFRDIRYSLQDSHGTKQLTPSLTVPYLSLDGNLYLDQIRDDASDYWSLEPRLKYLNIPASNAEQVGRPVFDTEAMLIEDYRNLFANNRYTGGDRIGNTEQLSAGVTAKFIEGQSGSAKLQIQLGQVFYFEDREPALENELADSANRSDIFLGIDASIKQDWTADTSILWNTENKAVTDSTVAVERRKGNNNRFRALYRNLRTEGEQIGSSLAWQATPEFSWQWKSIYSLNQNRMIETELRTEYQSCCWTAGVRLGQYLSDGMDETYIFLYFEAEGLGTRQN